MSISSPRIGLSRVLHPYVIGLGGNQ